MIASWRFSKQSCQSQVMLPKMTSDFSKTCFRVHNASFKMSGDHLIQLSWYSIPSLVFFNFFPTYCLLRYVGQLVCTFTCLLICLLVTRICVYSLICVSTALSHTCFLTYLLFMMVTCMLFIEISCMIVYFFLIQRTSFLFLVVTTNFITYLQTYRLTWWSTVLRVFVRSLPYFFNLLTPLSCSTCLLRYTDALSPCIVSLLY